jgi:hypothetical protein
MQPDDSPTSVAAPKRLLEDGICDFDLTMGGARLRPIRFDSRKCTEQERHFHSFVGETAVADGLSPKIRNSFGALSFIGFATAAPSKRSSNTRDQSMSSVAGPRNCSATTLP